MGLEVIAKGDVAEVGAMLRRSPLFRDLDEHHLRALSEITCVYRADTGTPILREGEKDGRFYLLVEGMVDIFKDSNQGSPRKVARIHPGGTLGEISLIDNLPYSATAIVAEPATIIALEEADFELLATGNPDLHHKILRKISLDLSARLRHTTDSLNNYLGKVADLTETLHHGLDAYKSKTHFLASMSHELRTPLNAIIGFSEMFEEEITLRQGEQNLEDVKRIQIAGRHMLGLINNILEYTKMGADKMTFQLDLFELPSLVSEVVTMMHPLAMANQNRLTARCDGETGEMIADKTKIRQALINLLGNSCKFTSNGFISLEVTRQDVDGKDTIEFAVSDTGVGMSRKDMKTLFQVYGQSPHHREQGFGGTGLGLFITKYFCERMGGSISVESEEGKGSTFTMRIPATVKLPG